MTGYSERYDKKNGLMICGTLFLGSLESVALSLPFLFHCRGPNQDKTPSTSSLSVAD